MKEKLRTGTCDWKAIQRKAIPVQKSRVLELKLEQLVEGIYDYTYAYDSFLGIMAGILSFKDV